MRQRPRLQHFCSDVMRMSIGRSASDCQTAPLASSADPHWSEEARCDILSENVRRWYNDGDLFWIYGNYAYEY